MKETKPIQPLQLYNFIYCEVRTEQEDDLILGFIWRKCSVIFY